MTNVKINKNGTKLTIEVDLSVSGTPSKSGKSMVIASSEGNVNIDSEKGIYLGLNVYRTR